MSLLFPLKAVSVILVNFTDPMAFYSEIQLQRLLSTYDLLPLEFM